MPGRHLRSLSAIRRPKSSVATGTAASRSGRTVPSYPREVDPQDTAAGSVADSGRAARAAPAEPAETAEHSDVSVLPEALAAVLPEYARHLRAERDLTPHTVRAYLGDVTAMLEHAALLGHGDLSTVDLQTLRSWLAKQQTLGRARTTMSRRATAIRVFTAWAQRVGRIPTDPGALLGSPKAHRTLPPVLRVSEVRRLLDAAAEHAREAGPVGLRDVAMLELLYATGIRVGELCGLDLDDVDDERRVIRVLGRAGSNARSRSGDRPSERSMTGWPREGHRYARQAPALRSSWARGAVGSTSGRSDDGAPATRRRTRRT